MMAFGRPIYVEKHGGAKEEPEKVVAKPPQEQVDALHAAYVQQFQELFEKYKKVCGSGKNNLDIV